MFPTGNLLVTTIFLGREFSLELAQRLPCVTLAWHKASCSTPFGVTMRGFHLHVLDYRFNDDLQTQAVSMYRYNIDSNREGIISGREF